MKKLILLLLLGGLFFSGCATTGIMKPAGFALIADYSEPIFALGNGSVSKQGVACTSNFLGFIATGDSSLKAAKSQGELQEIHFVDQSVFRILGVYGRVCTIARGR